MTEEEAKTKWCPFVRLAAPVDSEAAGTAGNRYGELIDGNFRCIGSACMAWRWYEAAFGAAGTGRALSSADGYCGLAGVQ